MARHKADPLIVASLEEATVAVGEIAALDRKISAIEAEMQAEIDAARARARQRAQGLPERRKEIRDAVAVFAKLNKSTLFCGTRTLDLGYGKIGYRLSGPSIVQERGVTEAMSLAKLRELGLVDGIRIREELAKDVLLGWTDERLSLAGVRRQQRDMFYIDIPQEALPEGAA